MICKEHMDLIRSDPWIQPLSQAGMINNIYRGYDVMISKNANWIICTLVQVGDCWKYALEVNNKELFDIFHKVRNSLIPCYNCINRETLIHVW